MSERSESTYPESTAGPTSPIFGTASFSTFTTTALTSLWPPSTRRNSRSGSSCGSENQESESGTYQDDQSVAETEEGGIRLVADEVSNLDDNYEDEEEEEEENSEVSAGRNSQFSTDDTLSASYHIQTTSGEYTTTTPTRSSLRSYDESSTPVYSNPYLTSSSEQLAGTLSRTTLTPTYTGTPITHSRSYTTSSLSGRPTYSQASPQKRTAGELIAFYEQQAHSRAASAPMETGFSRPGSPTKPGSQSYSVPVGMPGALAAPRHTHDARSWRSGGSGKTLSSWSFESDRSRSPVKSTSDTGSAPSGSVISGTSGYTRSGSTRSGYAGGLMSAIGGLVGFSSSSATSSRALSTSSRSPSRRTRSPPTTPRRKERTASSPRSAFSQIRRSPKGKARERDSPRSSPSPTRSRARSSRSGTESVQDAPSVHSTIPPPLDVAEYGGSGEPVNSAPVWYLNVHRLPPYTWNYAEGYLFPNMLLLSWVAPGGGRVVVKLDLLSCVEIRTSRAQGASDVTVEREGETHRLQTFELGYGDSIERLGCETRVEMLDWFNSIQSVFNGIMSMTESERAHGRPASPAQTISSFDFGSGSDSVLSAQLRSAPVSGNPSQSYRSREYRPQTPTVPLAEGVLRGSTPPIDTTVSRWRSLALEDSSDTSSAIEDAPPPQPAIAQPTIPVTVPTLSTTSHTQLTHSHSQFSQPHQLSSRYAPSTTSHSQTITQSLSSGTLYNGARTIMEIGSSTGTDIVASTLSFRGTASASLLGDSCAPTTIETASTITDRYHRRVVGPGAAQSTSASGYGYIAELDEPQPYDATGYASPAPRSNVSEDVQQGQGASGGGQDQVGGSPAEQSDSDYVTAASPTASFVSLSGMSAFPDDDEEGEVVEQPSLPDPMPEEATPVIERPPTPSEVEVETVKPDDLASTVAPVETEAESTVDEQSKDSDVSTPIVASLEPEEPVQAVEVSGEPEPEPEPEPEIVPPPPPVLRVDASTQADVEPEPEVEEPVKDDTPQPELVPLPAPADTVYTPSVVSVGISPIPLAEPELVPGSPQSDVLSTLSGAVPELSQLPTSAEDTAVEVEPDTQSLSSGSLGIVAGTPMPSLTSDSLSDSLPTPEPAKRSPSVVESVWPAETDRSYESSVLNASPSLTVARTSTEYIGVAESPAISDIKTPASLLKAQTEVLSVAEEDKADDMTFDASDVDSADDVSTPTAGSWVSSLPPSVPSNTLNETESVSHEPSEVEQANEADLASSVEVSTIAEVSSHPKVFAEEACQADFVIEHPPLSPRLIPLPISRPPSRHSISIAATVEKVDGGSSMDSDDVLADRFAELEHNLASSYSLGSDKIIDQLAGMGQALNKDHIELRNMLIEILENTRPELHEEVSAKSASAVSTVATVSQKVDVATSPILVAMVECSTSPPPVLLKEQAVSPVLLLKYRDMDAGMSHRSRQSVNSIMLTPPPRDAATPDTLMETMSYLSSHHSDDISEIDLELSQDPLQVDRVSPSWASDSSADSEELSEDEHYEAQEDEDGLESALGSPAQMSSLSMAREDGSVVEEDHLSGIATEVPGEGQRAVSSIAAGTLLRLPAAEAVTSDVVSLYHSESASGLSAIQMPVPTRAGLPFGGQLASLMTPEEKHVDQGVSAGYSDIGASYIHQATSPVHEAEPASSPSLAATFVDKEIDSTQPEPLDPVREDKSVATFPDEDRQEQSIDTDLTQGREEKLVDAIPDSVYEEKLVDAIPDSVYEEKGVDTEPEAREEEAMDTTPEDIQEEKSVDVDAVLETHEEKAVDTELESHGEKAVDTTPEDIHEEKSLDALPADGEDKEVDALPPAGEDKEVDALPPAGEDKEVDALPPAGEDKEIDAHFTGETEEAGTDAPLATALDDKSIDALPVLVLEEKAVDTTPEVTSDTTTYAEKDCDTADLVDASAITLDDVAAPSAVDLPKTVTQDAEVQAADLTKMLVPPFSSLSDMDQSAAPPIMALPTFLQDQPTFSAHMKDIVSSGLSPALENVALLVYENRMARDEFKKANEDYESMVREEFKKASGDYESMVRDELRKAHDDYRQTHEESIVQIKEMYRMAQDEMMNSLAQMKDLVSQLMSQKPVSVSVSVPQQHSYPIPPGFVPNANSEQAVYQQPMMYPAPPVGSYSQPISQQPIFMPTPDVNGVPSPVPEYLYREGPVVPSPPPLSPTLSESSGTSSSSATPTLASMHILPTGYAVEPSTVARGAMVPLPPSPISLSPQPLHLPFTSQTDTRDLPVVPEMPAAESPYMMLQPSLTGVGHASEYYAGHVDSLESSEASSTSHGTDTPSGTPILPMQEADAPAVIPELVEPEPVAESEPQSESSVEPVEPVTEEPSAGELTENDDPPMTSDVAATHAPTVVEDAEDNESYTSQSDMSGLTTPPRPSTPADALTRDIDLSAAESQEPSSEDPSDDSPVVPDLPEESKSGPNLDMDAAEVQPVAPHALAHEIEASIAAAASDLKSVVEAARGATEGALAASKEAQSMLESVRAQREEVARELEECTREREAAKADRDEAQSLREQTLAQAAADREQGVAERDARIEELQQELEVIKAKEIELETSHANAVSERETRIQTLEEELGTVRSELEEQKEARAKEQAERGAQDEEREKAHAEANAEHDARIAALEEELASLRASQEDERQAHATQDEQHQKALEEATSEREREVGERDSRIQALEQELETMRSEHDEAEKRREAEQAERDEAIAERERTFTEAAAERDARIESLESDLTALREETEREREEHQAAIAKLEEAQQASEGAHTEAIAEHQRQIEERDQRISALEEELSRPRSDHEAELLQRAAEVEALTATWTEQEKVLNDASAERDERIKALEDQLTEVRAEHEQIQQDRDLQDTERHAAWDEREQALQEAAADRDSRISALEEELSSLRAEREQEKQQLAEEQAARVQRERDLAEEALERERLSSERQDNRIKELTDEIAALRAEREQERQQREIEDAERREADRAEARELAESQTVKLTGIQEKLEQLAEQSTERFGTVDTRLEKIAEESTEQLAGIDTKLEKMAEESIEKFAGVDVRLEKILEDSTEKFSGVDARFATVDTKFDKLMEEATERSSGLDSKLDKLAEESIERSSSLDSKLDKITEESIERFSALDSKFDKLAEESLERTSALDSKLDKITEESVERSNALDSKLDKITEESVERSNALGSKLDKITEESVERSNTLDSKLDKLVESSTEQFTNFDSKIDKLAEASTEQFQNVETRFAAVEQLSTERFTTLDSQLEKMNEASTEKFAAVEGQLAKIDEEAVKARELHEQEMAEAAAKPTVEALFEEHIGVLKAQVQEQMDALQNELKNDGSRQHEEIMANVRATIEEQSAMLVTTCLDELGKLLESIGAQQQAEILSAMRVTIQEQVTFNISYYLDELTKMFDAHGVRSLAETIEAVRATAREQVPYNTEGHLTDFCKNLAPEMLQLFQEIKEKAEEKSRLDRQIDILRRHKHDYEAGDLRGDEYTDAIPVPPPQQIHVTRSDADLHKAWRGRRPTRRDEPTEIPYSQTGSRSHHSIYPDQWSHNSYDSQGGEVVLLPPQDDPMMPPRSPNASFYHQ